MHSSRYLFGILAMLSLAFSPAIAHENATAVAYVESSADPDLAAAIDNLDRVTPQLWRGAAPSAEGLQKLSDAGVKTIVDLRLRNGDEQEAAKSCGLNYIRIPLGYMGPSKEAIQKFLKVVTDQDSGRVYVHCRRGEDRTGTLVGVYRRVVQQWPFEQVYAEMRQHRFKPWFFALKETVEEASKNFEGEFKSVTAVKLSKEAQQAGATVR